MFYPRRSLPPCRKPQSSVQHDGCASAAKCMDTVTIKIIRSDYCQTQGYDPVVFIKRPLDREPALQRVHQFDSQGFGQNVFTMLIQRSTHSWCAGNAQRNPV